MKIYVELVVVLILMTMFIGWRLWYDYSRKKILKKYNETQNVSKRYDDKSKEGGIFNKGAGVGTGECSTTTTPSDNVGHEQSEGRVLLQEKPVDDAGKNSNSTGNDGRTFKERFFRRRNKN